MRPAIKVGLSTASVYPLRAEAAFEYADRLGYDGVELMVWGESVSQDIDAVRKLSRRYRVPVLSVHAPCLLISQRVWGANPILKLDRSVRAAEQLGAQTVVVHPPFRWQRRYAEGFSDQVAALEAASTVMVAVENMFPFRADRFFGAGQSRERMRKRGGGPGPAISAFAPSYDPLDGNHAHYTLDLSHTATAGTDSLDMARRMGPGLVHLHLCDGSGLPADEHLVPGRGTQPTAEVCQMLAGSGFVGHVVLEVSTSSARSANERESMLAESLQFARTHLLRLYAGNTMNALFTTAMALRPLYSDPGNPACRVFEGELNEHWTIGPKVHGGAMVALCANAARTAYGAAGQQPMRQPVAVSASFLWAPDPGTMRLVTSIRKRGRRISVADVELTQGGRTAVHAVVTLGEPEHFLPGVDGSGGASGTAPLLSANPVVELMAPEPPEGVVPIGPGHQLAGLVHLGEGCDVRPVLSTLRSATDGRPPVIQLWARPRGVAPDALFALLCGDLSAPVTFAVDRTGWAPTVALTAYLRALPADGWLRVLCTCVEIGQDWFDEDHIVVDRLGRIVVQTRQLAMVPAQ